MKIFIIGPAPPLRGGIAHYNTQLCLELSKNHQVTPLSFCRQYPSFIFPGRTQLDPEPPALLCRDEVRRLPIPMLDSINPLNWLKVAGYIIHKTPDLVIVHWWHPFFAPCLGTTIRMIRRRSRNTRVVFICHNVLPHEPFPAAMTLTRLALSQGQAWIVHSETDRQRLMELGLDGPVYLIPQPPAKGYGSPLNREEAKSSLGLSGNLLLFFGLIRRYKGLPSLIQALPLVLKEVECTLLVVGEFYEDKDHCLKLIHELGLQSRIRIIDQFVPASKVNLYFSAADLVVLPYESATQSAIVPIAFTFERPVLATCVGGLPEAVRDGETGLLVEPRNPPALAEAIIRFYKEDLGSIFRRHILNQQHFSWGELAATLEAAAISRTSQ